MREGEDEEVALAGDDDAEEAAVGRNGKFAEAKPVENGNGRGLRNGDFFVGRDVGERRNGEPNDVAGFFLGRTLEEDARSVGSPAIDTEANAHASELIGMGKAADFENFAVDEVRGHGAIGRNGEAAFVAVERGKFFVGIAEDIEILQAGRPGHGMVLLDGDGEIHSRKPNDVAKGAPFVRRGNIAGREARDFDGKERKRRVGLGEVSDGVVVGEKGRVGGV